MTTAHCQEALPDRIIAFGALAYRVDELGVVGDGAVDAGGRVADVRTLRRHVGEDRLEGLVETGHVRGTASVD